MRSVRLGICAAVLLGLAAVPTPARATNDPKWTEQWGPPSMGVPSAWNVTRGEGVIVAVVDSGVDVDHPDLKDHLLLVQGADVTDGDDDPDDDSTQRDSSGKFVRGHGTHVAGTIGAIADNGMGVAGVAPEVQIMPLKVFPSTEQSSPLLTNGLATDVPTAIRKAIDEGASVINLSIGGIQGANLLGIIETPCTEAYQRNVLCVVAAGNDGTKPSGYDRNVNFLTVTAHKEDLTHASFGQHADTKWAVSAPGVGITSTYPVEDGSYTRIQGTSMAAPHASGAAALLFATGLDVDGVLDALLSTADQMNPAAINGAGRINIARALGQPFDVEGTGQGTAGPETRSGVSAGATAGSGTSSGATRPSNVGSSAAQDTASAESSLDALNDLGATANEGALDFSADGQVGEERVVEAEDRSTNVDAVVVVVFGLAVAAIGVAGAAIGRRSRVRALEFNPG